MPRSSSKRDKRLAPGSLLVIVREHELRARVAHALRSIRDMGHPLLFALDASSLRDILAAPIPPKGSGRKRPLPWPPLLGIVYAWEGGAVDVLAALEVSPRTRMLAFPARDRWAAEMPGECRKRKIVWAHGEPDADQLAIVYQRLFLPFEETRIDFRKWAIELAREDAEARRCLPEHLLRVAEGAILHGLPDFARAAAHGVERRSAERYVERICEILGGGLDELRARDRSLVEARGAPAAPLFDHPSRGATETVRQRPAARRTRPPRPLSIDSIDL